MSSTVIGATGGARAAFSRPRAGALGLVGVVALVASLVACSGGGEPSAATAPPTTAALGAEGTGAVPAALAPAAMPQRDATTALTALLGAEIERDHETSFRYLSSEARETFRDFADWARHRRNLPTVTGFTIDDVGEDGVLVATVEHTPGLDAFVGLSPARERQTWQARAEGSGWVLDAPPIVEALLPDPAGAVDVAATWATGVQACDRAAAEAVQFRATLIESVAVVGVCRGAGTPRPGAPGLLPAGPRAASYVSQYGTAVYEWAAVVPITGLSTRFSVVLAPIGDEWRVIGALPA